MELTDIADYLILKTIPVGLTLICCYSYLKYSYTVKTMETLNISTVYGKFMQNMLCM